MMESIVIALIYLAIILVIAKVIISLFPTLPAPVPSIIWAVVTIACLVVLLDFINGGHYLWYGRRGL